MAGLWERTKGDGAERINIHFIVAGLSGYFVNSQDNTVGFTRIQVRDGLNAILAESGYAALTAAEETDLNGIADTLDAQQNNTAKLIFLRLVEALFIAAEAGQVSETKWRNDLGI